MPPDDDIAQSFTRFLRKVSNLKCPSCGETFPNKEERIKSHLQQKHQDLLSTTDLGVLVQRIKRGNGDPDPRELAVAHPPYCLLTGVADTVNADHKGTPPPSLAVLPTGLELCQ